MRLRSGAQVLGRILRDGRWQHTARGREIYQRQLQIVVRIPVVEWGDGDREWEVGNTFFPVSGATLPGLNEEYVRNPDNLKRFILLNLANRRDDDGNLVVWEGSEVIYTLLDEEWIL